MKDPRCESCMQIPVNEVCDCDHGRSEFDDFPVDPAQLDPSKHSFEYCELDGLCLCGEPREKHQS